MKVERHDRLEAVDARAWHGVHAASSLRSPFLSWTWQHEWVRAFLGDRKLEVWTVSDEQGDLTAVLPLYEVRPGLFRIVGGVDVSDYLDLIAVSGREEEAWKALLDAQPTSPTIWELHAVPKQSPTVTALPALGAVHGRRVDVVVEDQCPVLDLPSSWDAYLARLPGKHRHELQRKIRRFEREAPDGRVSRVERPEEVEQRLPEFLDLHRLSRPGKARFMDPKMERFFERVARELSGEGKLALWFLDTAAGPVASFITLEWDATVGLYNSGFRPDRAPWAPGLVLLAHMIRDAIERGRRRFDFLRGEERYKYEFGPSPEEVYAVTVAPRKGLEE